MPRTPRRPKQGSDEHPTITALQRKVQRQDRTIAHQAHVLETIKDRDHVRARLEESHGELIGLRLEVGKVRDERDFLNRQFDALLERYVGVKLDTQQINFTQARLHLEAERAARDTSIEAIRSKPRSLEFTVQRREAA
jgi:hypothetical protein